MDDLSSVGLITGIDRSRDIDGGFILVTGGLLPIVGCAPFGRSNKFRSSAACASSSVGCPCRCCEGSVFSLAVSSSSSSCTKGMRPLLRGAATGFGGDDDGLFNFSGGTSFK